MILLVRKMVVMEIQDSHIKNIGIVHWRLDSMTQDTAISLHSEISRGSIFNNCGKMGALLAS
jgi:hypothetical protein